MNQNGNTLLGAITDAIASMFYLNTVRIEEASCYERGCIACDTNVTFNGAPIRVVIDEEAGWLRSIPDTARLIAETILDPAFHDIKM